MTGSKVVTTEMTLPVGAPAGNYSLVVTANGNASAPVPFTVVSVPVTGRIALEGVSDLSAVHADAPLGTFHVEFRTPGTSGAMYFSDVSLTTAAGSAYGTYSLNIPPGTYDVWGKGSKNLAVRKSNAVIAASGVTNVPDVTLPAGDATGDNICDVLDFGALVNTYGAKSSVAGSGYEPDADFDFNGVVDVLDFGLLVNNYGTVGAN